MPAIMTANNGGSEDTARLRPSPGRCRQCSMSSGYGREADALRDPLAVDDHVCAEGPVRMPIVLIASTRTKRPYSSFGRARASNKFPIAKTTPPIVIATAARKTESAMRSGPGERERWSRPTSDSGGGSARPQCTPGRELLFLPDSPSTARFLPESFVVLRGPRRRAGSGSPAASDHAEDVAHAAGWSHSNGLL